MHLLLWKCRREAACNAFAPIGAALLQGTSRERQGQRRKVSLKVGDNRSEALAQNLEQMSAQIEDQLRAFLYQLAEDAFETAVTDGEALLYALRAQVARLHRIIASERKEPLS